MRRSAAAAGALASLIGAALMPASATDAGTVGLWLAPISEDGDGDGIGDFAARPPASAQEASRIPTAVNVVVLPDGRVLYWSQLDGSETVNESIVYQQPERPHSRTRVLDLASYFATEAPPGPQAWTIPTPEEGVGGDHLGSDQRLLSDGRALAIGGAEWSNDNEDLPIGRTELYGLPSARLYDPATNAWSRTGDMNVRRYYPSLITLPDGKLLVAGGAERVIWQTDLLPARHPSGSVLPENVGDVETYDPASGAWTLADPDARADMVMFAHLHLMPDGRVFHPSAGMIFPPGGADKDMAEWNRQRMFDPATQRWTDAGLAPLGVRGNAFSVLMPLVPPYDRATVIVGGGTLGQWPGSYLATAVTETITWADGAIQRELGPPMTAPRWHSTAVVLPSGELLALNGADKDEVVDPGSGIAVRHVDMYSPAESAWTRLASGARDRTLHSTAVLLRDGSVLVGGHSPIPAHYGSHRDNPEPFSNNYKDPSFEIFQPPYLFRGPRPVIQRAILAADTLHLVTPDAQDSTLQVVLSRLPSTTHAIDNDQRTIELEYVADGLAVHANVPDDEIVPPGYYYVFLLKDNGEGPTPSVAEIVLID